MAYVVRSDIGIRPAWLMRGGKVGGRWQYHITEQPEFAFQLPFSAAEALAHEWSDFPGVWRPVYRLKLNEKSPSR